MTTFGPSTDYWPPPSTFINTSVALERHGRRAAADRLCGKVLGGRLGLWVNSRTGERAARSPLSRVHCHNGLCATSWHASSSPTWLSEFPAG